MFRRTRTARRDAIPAGVARLSEPRAEHLNCDLHCAGPLPNPLPEGEGVRGSTAVSRIIGSRLAALACGVIASLHGAGCGAKLAGGNFESDSILSVFGPPTPAEAARLAADPYDPDKRQHGLRLLGAAPWGGEDVYLRFYEQALNDEDQAVRAAAASAIGRHGSPEDVELLIPHLTDESPIVRRQVAQSLQRLHNPIAIRPLILAADVRTESDSETRAAASHALGQYADPLVVQALITSLRDSRLLVNQAALDSLIILTGQDFGYDIGGWLQWSSRASDLFAGRGSYVYPVYQRDYRFVEFFIPWMQPPNETAATPAGLTRGPTSPPSGG